MITRSRIGLTNEPSHCATGVSHRRKHVLVGSEQKSKESQHKPQDPGECYDNDATLHKANGASIPASHVEVF